MSLVKVDGNAKINLTLDILGTRPDGYHEVEMIMQSVALHDTLTLERAEEGIALTTSVPWLRADDKNLAWRAAALVKERYGLEDGVRIYLTKRIPVAAGLAGGSADAAAVLRGMDRLFHLRLSDAELCALGAELGSDVPFCLMGGTCLASGRGEVLRRLASLPPVWVVLAKPRVSVSTAWAYKNYDELGADRHPDNALAEEKIKARDIKGLAPLLCNVLESVTVRKYGVIEEYKELMLKEGALAAMMSGSGPTVFALTTKKSVAQRIAASLRHHTRAAVFVTYTVGSGTRFAVRRRRHY